MNAGRNDVRYVLAMVVLMLPLSGRASETIHVRLMDNAIQIDTDTTRPGNVTFEVSNEAKSNTQHEFVVLRTDTDEARLPVHNGRVTESRFRKMGEVDGSPGIERLRKPPNALAAEAGVGQSPTKALA